MELESSLMTEGDGIVEMEEKESGMFTSYGFRLGKAGAHPPKKREAAIPTMGKANELL